MRMNLSEDVSEMKDSENYSTVDIINNEAIDAPVNVCKSDDSEKNYIIILIKACDDDGCNCSIMRL